MAIIQRGKNRYKIQIYNGKGPKGNSVYKYFTFNGPKREALKYERQLKTEIDQVGFVEDPKLTLTDYLLLWLSRIEPELSPKTHERYSQLCKNNIIPHIGKTQLKKINSLIVETLYSQLRENGRIDGKGGLNEQTVLHVHRVLNTALNRACEWNLLARNPIDKARKPKPPKHEMNFLSSQDIKFLLEISLHTRLYIPIMIALYTGMRRGEIAALKWSNVDLDNQYIVVSHSITKSSNGLIFKSTKNGKSRGIAISSTLVNLLRKQKKDINELQLKLGSRFKHNLVCPNIDGSIWNPDNISSAFKNLTRKYNLPYNFHSLRHTHVALMIMLGESPKFICDRLGHSTINITMDLYGHLYPDTGRNAAEKLDNII